MLTINTKITKVFGGVPQNFGRVCCSIGPPKTMFYCIFKKEFGGGVLFYGTKFFSKNLSKTRYIFENLFKKSMFYASK